MRAVANKHWKTVIGDPNVWMEINKTQTSHSSASCVFINTRLSKNDTQHNTKKYTHLKRNSDFNTQNSIISLVKQSKISLLITNDNITLYYTIAYL